MSDKDELKASKKALTRLGAKIVKIKNYKIADQERTIILIEKFKETPAKYPRTTGIPLSKPL